MIFFIAAFELVDVEGFSSWRADLFGLVGCKARGKEMRKILIAMCAVVGLGVLTSANGASAAPMNGAPIIQSLNAGSMVQKTRVYCYNRYTGRFLHWGSCGGHRRYYHPHYYRPHYHHHYRVFCYNRRTGRFLHWGHC